MAAIVAAAASAISVVRMTIPLMPEVLGAVCAVPHDLVAWLAPGPRLAGGPGRAPYVTPT